MDHIPDRDLIDEIDRRLHRRPEPRDGPDSIDEDEDVPGTAPPSDIEDRSLDTGMRDASETVPDDRRENEPDREDP